MSILLSTLLNALVPGGKRGAPGHASGRRRTVGFPPLWLVCGNSARGKMSFEVRAGAGPERCGGGAGKAALPGGGWAPLFSGSGKSGISGISGFPGGEKAGIFGRGRGARACWRNSQSTPAPNPAPWPAASLAHRPPTRAGADKSTGERKKYLQGGGEKEVFSKKKRVAGRTRPPVREASQGPDPERKEKT